MTDRALRKVTAAIRGLAVALVLLAGVTPPGAAALEPGVHGDPGSPAGKEYAFPLGAARGIGGSGGLFGTGITSARPQPPPRAAANPPVAPVTGVQPRAAGGPLGAADAQRGPAGAQGGPAGASSTRRRVQREQPAGGHSAGATTSVSDGSSGVTWLLAAALCVIALGAACGQALAWLARANDTRTDLPE